MIKDLPVTVTYREEVVTVKGEGLSIRIKITGKQARKAIWGGDGKATLLTLETKETTA